MSKRRCDLANEIAEYGGSEKWLDSLRMKNKVGEYYDVENKIEEFNALNKRLSKISSAFLTLKGELELNINSIFIDRKNGKLLEVLGQYKEIKDSVEKLIVRGERTISPTEIKKLLVDANAVKVALEMTSEGRCSLKPDRRLKTSETISKAENRKVL